MTVAVHVVQVERNLLERYQVSVVVHLLAIGQAAVLNYLVVLVIEVFVVEFTLAPVEECADLVGEAAVVTAGQILLELQLFDPQVFGLSV